MKNMCGTYVHGIFDKEESALALIRAAGKKKGIDVSQMEGVDLLLLRKPSMIFWQQSFGNTWI